jgi:hypothetical protein
MNAAEIVIREVQSNSGFQVGQLLAESICQSRKSPHRHSHREVLSFDKRSADLSRIGIAKSDFGYNPRDARRGVPRIGSIELPVVAKHLRQLREVHIRSEALRNTHRVVVQPVSRELHAVRNAMMQVPEEGPCIGANALARCETREPILFPRQSQRKSIGHQVRASPRCARYGASCPRSTKFRQPASTWS